MADPDLDELSTFLMVATSGSLAGAARLLRLPKSTVSRRLSRLEEKLGLRLIQRTTRRLSLTEEGLVYRERVADALAALQEANEAVREQQVTPRGHLRLTAPTDLALAGLGDLVAEFVRRYPETTVEVLLTERTVDLVGEGIDLALRATPAMPDSTLVAHRVATLQLIPVATPAYLEREGRPDSLEALGPHRFVLMSPMHGRGQLTLRGPWGERGVSVRLAVSASDYSFVHRVTRADAGIGILPSLVAAPDLRAGKLERVLPGCTAGDAGLFVVHPGGRLLSAKVRAFRDLVFETFRTGEATRQDGRPTDP